MGARSRTLAPDPAELVLPDQGDIVSRVRAVGSDGSVVSVVVGRTAVARIDSCDLEPLGLAAGVPWTGELASRVGDAAAALAARKHALRLLASRPRAKADLVRRLRRAGHKDRHASAAADALESAGVIDDRAFAEAAAGSLASRKGVSRRAVETKLRTRGVAADEARRAAREATEHIDERQTAVELATRRVERQQKPSDPAAARRRLYAFLLRRGFNADDARHATEAALAAQPDDLD